MSIFMLATFRGRAQLLRESPLRAHWVRCLRLVDAGPPAFVPTEAPRVPPGSNWQLRPLGDATPM
jgi:hypothetical protein